MRFKLNNKQVEMLINGESLIYLSKRITASEKMRDALREIDLEKCAVYIVRQTGSFEDSYRLEIGMK